MSLHKIYWILDDNTERPSNEIWNDLELSLINPKEQDLGFIIPEYVFSTNVSKIGLPFKKIIGFRSIPELTKTVKFDIFKETAKYFK